MSKGITEPLEFELATWSNDGSKFHGETDMTKELIVYFDGNGITVKKMYTGDYVIEIIDRTGHKVKEVQYDSKISVAV